MPILLKRTFEHAGRRFELLAETHSDPSDVEAQVWENGYPLRLPYGHGILCLPTFGALFPGSVRGTRRAAIEDLMDVVEADARRRITPL